MFGIRKFSCNVSFSEEREGDCTLWNDDKNDAGESGGGGSVPPWLVGLLIGAAAINATAYSLDTLPF